MQFHFLHVEIMGVFKKIGKSVGSAVKTVYSPVKKMYQAPRKIAKGIGVAAKKTGQAIGTSVKKIGKGVANVSGDVLKVASNVVQGVTGLDLLAGTGLSSDKTKRIVDTSFPAYIRSFFGVSNVSYVTESANVGELNATAKGAIKKGLSIL